MKRELAIGLTLLFTVQATATWAMSPVQFGSVSASGVVDATKAVVTAPRVTAPGVVIPMNSFAKGANPTGSAAVNAAVSASVNATSLRSGSVPVGRSLPAAITSPIAPAGVVLNVYVSEGQHVGKGARLAKIDDRLLRLAVRRNVAATSQAKAQLLVINSKIAELEFKRRQLEDAKALLAQGKAQLANARVKLIAGLSKLSAAQAKLNAQAKKLSHLRIPKFPTPPPPSPPTTGTPPPSKPPAFPKLPNIALLKAKLAAAQGQLAAGRAQLQAGFAMLEVQAAKLAAAEAKLEAAQKQLAKAKVQLGAARRLAAVNVRIARISASASRSEMAKTIVLSPAAGVVTDLKVDAGELAFSSQPLMTISKEAQVKLLLYLPPDEVQMIRVGQRADVSIDTFATRTFPARVALIASTVGFAPSNVSTDRVYLTQVQAVTLTIDNPDGILKPGMPADAQINLR